MSQAYYHSTIEEFIHKNSNELIGTLNKGGTDFVSQWTITTTSWDSCIEILKFSLSQLIEIYEEAKNWKILFEFEIPRLGRRIDAVIIANDIIFVIEFKYDRKKYLLEDIRQVEDYANDLRDFHLESQNRIVLPVLLAPRANLNFTMTFNYDSKNALKANSNNFSDVIYNAYKHYHNNDFKGIDSINWEKGQYRATPSIIQAAKSLFAGQKVETITQFGAEETDLDSTTDYLIGAIKNAIQNNKKIICFVTGVPGAGKTLVGLNIVHARTEIIGEEIDTAYFSGNGPLINVLKEALARDHYQRQTTKYSINKKLKRPTKADSSREVKSKIQNLHNFIKDGIRQSLPPTEKIVIFDEAQRCWNAIQFSNKAKQNQNREKNIFDIELKSEAELLFEIMNRHKDWSVIIALVGGGQEINTGEGGILEWGKALSTKYQNWEIHISEELLEGALPNSTQKLFNNIPLNAKIFKNKNLHLNVSRRSFKANNLNSWVNAVLEDNFEKAALLSKEIIKKYPIYLTRDLLKAKQWLKEKKSGTKRIGLVASSGGLRLKSYGINVREEIDEALWFLNNEDDVRSSYYLESVATEYKVQGLELDWVGICWDLDLRRDNQTWSYKNFSGTKWNNTKNIAEQIFLLNTYRVLLTRAREGIIIFVPLGNEKDETALPEYYDPIFDYLALCGAIVI